MERLQPPESELIVRLRNGEEAAFRSVYDNYSGRLYGFAYRFLKNREQSEEIVQETLLNLWSSREQLDEHYPLGPYLYTIARRLTLNILRKTANSRLAYEALWKAQENSRNSTEESILFTDLQRSTEQTLAGLPHRQQLIFRLSRYEGLSHEEIANLLHISRNTVKNHLVQALKKLRLHIDSTVG